MIDLTSADKARAANPKTEQELYERLRDYVGSVVLIRHEMIERVGILNRLNFVRLPYHSIVYSFDSADRIELNLNQHVAVRIDSSWKVLNTGVDVNEELK